MSLTNIVQRGWDALGAGDFDGLVTDYIEEMIFVIPGRAELRGQCNRRLSRHVDS